MQVFLDKIDIKEDDPVSKLNLSVRSCRALKKLGVSKVKDLFNITAKEILAVRNMNMLCLNEIRTKLTFLGFKLKGDT